MEPVETIEHAGLRIEILQDMEPMSPRDADNLGILGFQQDTFMESEGAPIHGTHGFTEECSVCEGAGEYPGQAICEKCDGSGEVPMSLKAYFAEHYKAVEALPVRYADYGSSGSQAWITDDLEDANGVIYTTQERVDAMGVPAEDIAKALEAEIEEFSLWLEGNVYGYSIAGPSGEDLGTFGDSCWGFIANYGSGDSWDYFLKEAKSAAEGAREALDKQDIQPSEVTHIDAATRYAKAAGMEEWKLDALLKSRKDPEAMIFSDVDVVRAILCGKVVPS